MTAPLTMDSRDVPRRRVFLAGAIAGAGKSARMLCFVHDLTSTGAQLELAGQGTFSGDVQVDLPRLEKAVPAQIMWQDGQRVGIRFNDPLPN